MITKKSNGTSLQKETKAPKAGNKLVMSAANPKKASECCTGSAPCLSAENVANKGVSSNKSTMHVAEPTKGPKTRIVVKYDVGFNNFLSIRGKGAGLTWDKGIPLKNLKNDEWVWETGVSFNTGEFKVLINDIQYETGENNTLKCGATVQYTPHF